MNVFAKIKSTAPGLHTAALVMSILLAVAAVVLASLTEDLVYILITVPVAIALIVCLWVDLYVAGLFYLAANDKGYTESVYLTVAFLIPPAGYLLVCALPNKKAAATTEPAVEADELPEI